MGTRAVRETAGMVATHNGKPIMAYFTSTCGGRTENSENVFDHAEPYLRGVECSLEGRNHFEPFFIKTVRKPAKLRDDGNLELVRLMSMLAVNGFSLTTNEITDEWFEEEPTVGEISNWVNQLASRFGKSFPNVTKDSTKPLELSRILASFTYTPGEADTLLSDSDINYHLSFDDAAEVPKERRAELAMLMLDGYLRSAGPNFSQTVLIACGNVKADPPNIQKRNGCRPCNREQLDQRLTATRTPRRQDRQIATVRPDVFLFRQFATRCIR